MPVRAFKDAFNRHIIQQRYESIARQERLQRRLAESQMRIDEINRKYRERTAQALVNYHFKQQEAKQTAEVVNAGGLLGRLAYFASRK